MVDAAHFLGTDRLCRAGKGCSDALPCVSPAAPGPRPPPTLAAAAAAAASAVPAIPTGLPPGGPGAGRPRQARSPQKNYGGRPLHGGGTWWVSLHAHTERPPNEAQVSPVEGQCVTLV